MKLLLLSALFIASLVGQTAINQTQIKLTPPPPIVKLAAWDVNGHLTWLDIGPGVRVVNGTLTADTPVAIPVLVTSRMLQAADGTYQATNGIVVRNGAIQTEGQDYTVVAGVTTPTLSWGANETILSITSAIMMPSTAKTTP